MNINILNSKEEAYLKKDNQCIEQCIQQSKAEKDISHSPKISIIVPVYNAGEYLRPCLDTLVNQTFRDIEIICILDCPTDSSDKVIEEYARKDKRITVVKNDRNLHIGESRNVGLRVAKGEYIGFSDHDDTRTLDMYEKLYKAANNGEYAVVASGNLAMSVQKMGISSIEDIYYGLVSRRLSPLIMPNIYNRDFLIRNHICFCDTKTSSIEDVLFNVWCFQAMLGTDSKANFIPEYLYNHIFHNTNEVNSYDYWDTEKIINTIIELNNLTKQCDVKVGKYLGEMLIRSLYTSFRLSVKYKQFRNYRRAITSFNMNEILSEYPFRYNNHLSIMKNLYAFFLLTFRKR